MFRSLPQISMSPRHDVKLPLVALMSDLAMAFLTKLRTCLIRKAGAEQHGLLYMYL
jgi:hypothetical protein